MKKEGNPSKLKWRKFLPLIGIGLFVYILIKIDILEVFEEIRDANLLFLFYAFLIFIVYLFIQTLKWYVVARKQKIEIPYFEAFKINFIANFYGFVTPSKIGSIIRADYLKKYGSLEKGISNYMIDKVMDLAVVFSLAIFFGYLFKDVFNIASFNYIIIIFCVFIFLGLLFYNKKSSKAILRIVYRRLIPQKFKEKARTAFEEIYKDLPKKRFLLLVFLINITAWITVYFVTYLVGLSLGINLEFVYFLAILPISTLVAQIPITINGFGTREAVLISLFSLFGISSARVFSMSLLSLFISGVLPGIIGGILIFRNRNYRVQAKKE